MKTEYEICPVMIAEESPRGKVMQTCYPYQADAWAVYIRDDDGCAQWAADFGSRSDAEEYVKNNNGIVRKSIFG